MRLFDQSGRALVVGLDPMMDGSHPELPFRSEDGMPDVAPDVFPLAWPGHDAWQDPGSGWTPPLALPPVTGSTTTPAPSASPSAPPSTSPTAPPSTSPNASPSASSTP